MILTTDFPIETVQARKNGYSRISERKIYQSRIPLEKISVVCEGKIKDFQDEQKLKDFINTQPALQMILKNVLHIETKTISIIKEYTQRKPSEKGYLKQ